MKRLGYVIPQYVTRTSGKEVQAVLVPEVSWSIMIKFCLMVNPLAFTSSKISLSMSPSAPDDVPTQFAPVPRFVLCENQAISSDATSCRVPEKLFEWCPRVR